MHHVKNDKRSQTSANAIYKTLIRLLQSKSFDSITVSSICEESNISRATFYRNFDIIEDVLVWYGDVLVHKLLTDYFNLPNSKKHIRFEHFAFTYALAEYQYIEALSNLNKMHLLEPIVFTVLETAPLNYDPNENPYIKYAICAKVSSFFGVINCWIRTGRKESVEDIQNNIMEIDKYIHLIDVQN